MSADARSAAEAGRTSVDTRPVLFVADLHLSSAQPQLAQRFERLLGEEARGAQALYILGDLFEYWLGDDDRSDPLVESVLAALRALATSGVAIRFIHGNRDFLIGRDAAERGGFALLGEPIATDLFGRRALILHGDTLCTDDFAYQRYRRRIRSRWMQGLLRTLPLAARRAIAQTLRRRSERDKQAKPMTIMDVNAEAVAALYRAHDVDLVIHGHTHRPAHHRSIVDGRARERWVLQDWHDRRGGYLLATPTGIEAVTIAA